jgi:superfamily II DNA or RNA helicase
VIKLRDYQLDTIHAIYAAWDRGVRRPMATLATGLGKTIIFSWMINELIDSGQRPLVLVHRDELVRQTVDKIRMIAPSTQVGIVRGSQKEFDRPATVASVATLGRPRTLDRLSPETWTHIIVDECHHAAAPSYGRILDHFTDALAVGFTATPARGDGVGLGGVWDEEVIRRTVLWGIVNGHLVDVRGHAVTVDGLDLATVARSHGDYAGGPLGEAMVQAGAGPLIAAAYRNHARLPSGDLRKGILFAPDVPSAEAFATDLNAAGIRTAAITGDTPAEVRQRRYADVRDGRLDMLSSCMVLTEGFDLPAMSCAVIARPTQSQPLFAQMVGRVLRPSPGKADALVLDVCGIGGEHQLVSVADLSMAGAVEESDPELGPIYDDESLLEAMVRQESEIVSDALGRRIRGTLAAKSFELFDKSEHAWLVTAGGVYFVPTRCGLMFMTPETRPGHDPSTVRLGKTATQRRVRGVARDVRNPSRPGDPIHPAQWGWVHEGLSQGIAMAWAESIASELDPSIASRKSSWRRGNQPATDTQLAQAVRAGIVVPDGISKSDLADMLTVHYASMILDK